MTAVRRIGLVALTATLAASAAGYAAGLSLNPDDLTTFSSTSQVPAISTCTLTASRDTYGQQFLPNTTAGSATTFDVASFALQNRRAFVGFDLSGCSFAATADVATATLQLHLASAPSNARTYNLHRVTASWTEAALTWNNQPAVAASTTATAAIGTTSGVTVSLTVTSDVKAFVESTHTNHGWRIADASEAATLARTGTFNTREHATASTRPTLRIDYYP